jgi:hypothetical protein
MQTVTTIGLDIAKSVFQVHGIRRGRQGVDPPQAEAPLCAGILREAAGVPDWDRALRHVASLVARTQGTWACRSPDAASLCEALRQATEIARMAAEAAAAGHGDLGSTS